jgi:hypothetical protein
MRADDIAGLAAKLVAGDREAQHGTKMRNFGNIAEMWTSYMRIRRDPGAPLDQEDVGHMMVLLKIARTQLGEHNQDDHVDMVGYAACAGEVASTIEMKRIAGRGVNEQ